MSKNSTILSQVNDLDDNQEIEELLCMIDVDKRLEVFEKNEIFGLFETSTNLNIQELREQAITVIKLVHGEDIQQNVMEERSRLMKHVDKRFIRRGTNNPNYHPINDLDVIREHCRKLEKAKLNVKRLCSWLPMGRRGKRQDS